MKKPGSANFSWVLVWQFLGIGFEMILPPLLGAILGKYLDSRLNLAPALLVIGIVSGLAVAIWLVYRKFKRLKDI